MTVMMMSDPIAMNDEMPIMPATIATTSQAAILPAAIEAISPSLLLSSMLPIPIEKKRKTKRVTFHPSVLVAPFERVTNPEEKKRVWFQESEMKQPKSEGREILSLYRSVAEPQKQSSQLQELSKDVAQFFRGFESCTVTRQRQKLASNRAVLYGQKLGLSSSEIAIVYQQTNSWSSHVASVQAIHDYYIVIAEEYGCNTSPCFNPPAIHELRPQPLSSFAKQAILALRNNNKQKRRRSSSKIILDKKTLRSVNNEEDQSRRVRQRQL
jgi:hypothetical protein